MKSAGFRKGSSGSPKHTETRGDGSHLMGGGDRGTVGKMEQGPRIGPGVMGRKMRPDYDRNSGGDGVPKAPGRMPVYSEE